MTGNFCRVVMIMDLPVSSAALQLGGILIDFLDHALGLFELLDGVLQLAVENAPVCDYDDGIEQTLGVSRFLVEGSQLVRQPGDGVGLARAGRMLDKIVLPDPIPADQALASGVLRQAGDNGEK